MEIRNLATFVRIAQLHNFSKAAEQLGYSQSAITMQIKQLEEELNVRLFERIGKHIRLTQAGDRLLPRAMEVLNAVRRAQTVSMGQGEISGPLRIGTAKSLLISVLPPVIVEFSRRYPKVEVSTCTGLVEELFCMVRQNDIDLLFFLDKRIDFPEWVKVSERKEEIFFVASAASPLADRKKIPLDELVEQPFLLTEHGISYRYAFEQMVAQNGLEIHPFLETGNTDIITRMLLHNMGVSFLPGYVVQDYLRSGQLVALDVDCPEAQMWTQLVYHRDKEMSSQMEHFIELLNDRLGMQPAEKK